MVLKTDTRARTADLFFLAYDLDRALGGVWVACVACDDWQEGAGERAPRDHSLTLCFPENHFLLDLQNALPTMIIPLCAGTWPANRG